MDEKFQLKEKIMVLNPYEEFSQSEVIDLGHLRRLTNASSCSAQKTISNNKKYRKLFYKVLELFAFLIVLLLILFFLHKFYYLPLIESLTKHEASAYSSSLKENHNPMNLVEQMVSIRMLEMKVKKLESSIDDLKNHSNNIDERARKILDELEMIGFKQNILNKTTSSHSKNLVELKNFIYQLMANNFSEIEIQINKNKLITNDLLNQLSPFNDSLNENKLIIASLENKFNESSQMIFNLEQNLSKLDGLDRKISKIPNRTISILSLNESIEKYFDEKGKGINEYTGWYICNGLHGTPNLQGRFLVGLDELSSDFDYIGKTGGMSHVRLNISQMPSHTHEDQGHAHKIDLNTSKDGEHSHSYRDYYPSSKSSVSSSVVSRKENYFYHDIGDHFRATSDAGQHAHTINGASNKEKAMLIPAGGDLEHENKPPYYVVIYIMYFEEQ